MDEASVASLTLERFVDIVRCFVFHQFGGLIEHLVANFARGRSDARLAVHQIG